LDAEFGAVQIKDLRVITTLGVGGFGRVELVSFLDQSKSFALKQMKKSQVINIFLLQLTCSNLKYTFI
jgi:cGMP-dependent protein kinase